MLGMGQAWRPNAGALAPPHLCPFQLFSKPCAKAKALLFPSLCQERAPAPRGAPRRLPFISCCFTVSSNNCPLQRAAFPISPPTPHPPHMGMTPRMPSCTLPTSPPLSPPHPSTLTTLTRVLFTCSPYKLRLCSRLFTSPPPLSRRSLFFGWQPPALRAKALCPLTPILTPTAFAPP